MANDYGALMDGGAPAAPSSPYGSLMDAAIANDEARFRASTGLAVGTNPVQAATAKRVAGYLGVPPAAAEALPEEADRAAKIKAISDDTATAPVLRQRFTDADFAKLAHDDSGALSAVERWLNYAFSHPGSANTLAGDLGAGLHEGAAGVAGVFRAGSELVAPVLDPLERVTAIGGNPLRRLAEGFSSIAETNLVSSKELSPPQAGTVASGISGGVKSLAQNLTTLPLAFLPGGEAAALSAMVSMQGGQSYQQAREQGVPMAVALPYAVSQAAIEYATEKLPLAKLLGDVTGGAPLWRTLAHQAGLEIPGEQIATILQDLNDWAVLPENAGKPFSAYLAERPNAAAQTLIATVVGTGGNVAFARGLGGVTGVMADGEAKALRGEQGAQAFETLGQIVAASKVLERDPQTFQAFVEAAAENGPVQDVFISAEALAQSGVAEQVAAASPSVQAQFATALETGADIRIPVAEYATTIASQSYAQDLVEHLKVEADGFSRAEAQEFMKTHGDELRKQVEEALAGHDEAARTGRATVEAKILEQLTEAKRFTGDVNSQYASLAGAFYATQAERMGTTADEMFQRFPLRIQAQAPAGQALQQGERGFFTPGSNTITLLKTADLTTFTHEFGHAQLEMLTGIASQPDAPAEIRADMGALLDWFGVKAETPAGALEAWNRMTLDEKRQHHEQFARGFEAYLFEGKAPSVELRGIFQRFRSWLVSVYRNLKALNVELTDDVRGVMDRLLASEDQIRDAEAAASMGLLFKTPEEAAKFGVDWQAYHDQANQATAAAVDELAERGLKDMQWLSRAKARELKRLQKAADAKRREVEAEVRAEVMAQPVYQAWQYLTGKHPIEPVEAERHGKLNTADVRGRYGVDEGSIARTLAERGMLKADGEDPDITAELFAYDSGDAMMQALAAAKPPEDAIAEMTDQRMLERYGDITSPQALQDAANEAIHNLARAKFVATELKALQTANDAKRDAGTDKKGRPRSVAILPEAARQFAADLIARLKVRDISPGQYQAAEARAAREAAKAFKAGDVVGAARDKRNQLINHFATKEAHTAQSEAAKALKYFARVERSDAIDHEYRDQIEQLLDRYSLKAESLKAIDKRKSLKEWVAQQLEAGLLPEIPEALLEGIDRKSYRDMTVEELRGLVDTVKQIEHIGRLKAKLLTARDQRTYEAIRDEIAASIIANGQGRKADTRTPTTNTGRWFQGVRNFGSAHIKAATWARIMDGGKDGGALWEHLIRSANERADQETTMRAEATQRLSQILAPVMKGVRSGKATLYPSIGRSYNREAVLAMALNTGNASNLQRLLGGEGWTIEQLKPVLDTLTAQEWQAVQAVWDHFETYRPLIAAKERRVYGKEPKWIEPAPVVTKFGTLRGGYYPVKYDPAASARAEERADAEEAAAQLKGAFSSATTRRSFTKTRAESVRGRPLLYTLQGLYGGVNEVIHDLAWHEWLIDANRLMRSDKIDTAMRETYGPAAVRQFKTWREAIAVGDAGTQEALDKVLGRLRQGVSVAGLGFNFMSAAMQPLGLTQSIVRVGGKWIGKGVAQYVANPMAAARDVQSKSEFMRNRARTRFRELNELRNQVQGQTVLKERMQATAYVMMMKMQQTVDVPTWLGAYEKGMHEQPDEDRAIALADQAVIDSQGGGQLKDLAAIERGPAGLKLFTVFYGFMNTALNLGVAQGMSPSSAAKKAADMLLLYTVPAVLGKLLKDALTPGDAGDDDETLLRKLLAAQLEFLFGLFVVGREFANVAKVVTGTPGGLNDYSGPAGLRTIPDTQSFLTQAHQGEFDDAFRKSAVNLLGSAMGLPAAQINRTVTGAQALSEGETENPAALVFGFQRPH